MESDFERPMEAAKVVEVDHDVSLKMHTVIFMLFEIFRHKGKLKFKLVCQNITECLRAE